MKRHGSLNRIYRLVWSRVTNCWVAVAETARGRGKGGGRSERRRLVAAMLSLTAAGSIAPLAQAGPTGGQVVSGSGTITQSGSTTTVKQNTANLSLNWNTFNIAPQETVDFVQPSASSIAVNRIFDTNGSQILGHIDANGQVYLINPNGILFGAGSQVNVGGLVASTLDISDAGLGGNSRSFSGSGKGGIVNQGTINAANGGYVALLGNHVSNQGVITAQLGTVALGAGNAVTLSFNGNSLVHMQVDQSVLNSLAENGGLIQADGGQVIMTAGAANSLLASVVNNTGVIEARTVQNLGNEQTGTITLLGGMNAGTVNVNGTLDASAPNGGNGGFIETSAASVKVADGTALTTLAPSGVTGSWLIDPKDYTVQASGGDITGTSLGSLLNSSNIAINSSSGASGSSGNVNINDTVTWSTHKLTVTASNDINVNAVMNAENNASVDLEPGSSQVNMGFGPSGFSGQINFFTDAGSTPRSGTGFLTINSTGYTVITSLGSQGSTTGTDLQGINGSLSGHFALGANINASATSGWSGNFTPIGVFAAYGTPFSGVFDGLGHTINGLKVSASSPASDTGWGLFGTSTGTIRNVGLTGGTISAAGSAGGIGPLVGINYGGTISNSFSSDSVSATTGSFKVGGLVGWNYAGTITKTYSTGAVTGDGSTVYVGGLVGWNEAGPISNSFATGNVSGGNYVGGLVGEHSGNTGKTGSISNTYATGSVSGTSYVGGLVGFASDYGGTSAINTSFAVGVVTGTVTNPVKVGGLIGVNSNAGGGTATVSGSYFNTTGNSSLSGIGSNGGSTASTSGTTGLTSANLMNPTNTSSLASGTWITYSGDTYPLLTSFMTPVTVTASNQSATYSGTTHAGGNGVTYTSYGATVSPTLSGTLTYSGSSQTATHAGSGYVITPGGQYSNQFGYLLTDANGSLTINQQTLTVTLSNTGITKTYDGNANAPSGFTPTYSYTGLVSGDTAGTITDTSATYNSAHVASATTLTVAGLNLTGITGSNGSLASDYNLVTASTAAGASITPATLTPTLTNAGVSKVYDGTTAAPGGFTPTYSFTGLVSGDTAATLSNTGTAYNSAHVAGASSVTVSGLGITSIAGSNSSAASDYTLGSNTSASGAASITPLTVTATAPTIGGTTTKVYDGTTSAIGASLSGGSVNGALSGDSLSLTDGSVLLSYNSAHVATASSIGASGSLGLLINSSTNGSQSTDYSLSQPTISSVPASITRASLTATVTNTGVTKVYDGTTDAPGGFSPTFNVTGFVSGDTAATLSNTGATYNSMHVADATTLTVSGLNVTGVSGSNGSQAGDYTLSSATAGVAATITAAPLTVSLSNVTNVTKTYDGTASAPSGFSPTYSVTGLVAGDTASVSSAGTPVFNSAHVATATAIQQGGLSLDSVGGNAVSGDYSLASTTAATGTGVASISPATLTPSLTNTGITKTYDGTTNAPSGFTPTYSFTGLVPGDTTATLTNTDVSYNSAHVADANTVTISGVGIGSISGSNGWHHHAGLVDGVPVQHHQRHQDLRRHDRGTRRFQPDLYRQRPGVRRQRHHQQLCHAGLQFGPRGRRHRDHARRPEPGIDHRQRHRQLRDGRLHALQHHGSNRHRHRLHHAHRAVGDSPHHRRHHEQGL
jgi:filamentous hemagglutinin family protein